MVTNRNLSFLGHPTGHATVSPPSSAPRGHTEAEAMGRGACITTEGGQATEAAAPGAAPVQVTERLQANSTCGHRAQAPGRWLSEEPIRMAVK